MKRVHSPTSSTALAALAACTALAAWTALAACTAPAEPPAAPASGPPTTAPAPASAEPAAVVTADPSDPAGPGGNGSGGGQGRGGGRFRQAALHVDGTPLAVLRYRELPPTLQPTWHERTTSEGELLRARRFAVADYLTALGIDLARVRAVHFYGGRQRVGLMPGSELTKYAKEITFSFTQGEAGKPRMHWPRDVEISDKIDMINDIAVYVDKAPPTWNADSWRLELGGQPVDGLPYRTQEVGGGARIYADGRLARVVRHRTLGAPTGDPPRWSLAAQLATAGIEVPKVVALDLVAGDGPPQRLPGSDLPQLTFELTPDAHGRITVHPGAHVAEAVLVYLTAPPPPSP